MTSAINGKAMRLARLSRHVDGRFLFVPMDHSVTDGPIADHARFGQVVRAVLEGGADAVVLHKGRARSLDPRLFSRAGLILHLSGGTSLAPDVNAKVLVAGVEEAIRIGADAVSVHVNIGSDTEAAQLADLGAVADACDRWAVPLIAMVYPRGPRIGDPCDPVLLAHMAAIAAELGADIVKTCMANPPERMAEVVAACPIPVIAAGGAALDDDDVVTFARAAMSAGCGGLAVGRRAFGSPAPRHLVHQLATVVHGHGRSAPLPLSPAGKLAGVR
ncbi:MAG: 2-amino-3,7-dideoxy-D-threo-hept-6-ulosonate synthase [Frankiaceae bacterium]